MRKFTLLAVLFLFFANVCAYSISKDSAKRFGLDMISKVRERAKSKGLLRLKRVIVIFLYSKVRIAMH